MTFQLTLSSSPDGHLTYLVSFAQSLIHYSSIATKLGVNISKQKENGNFVFVDCLTHLTSGIDSLEDPTSVPHSHSTSQIAFTFSRCKNANSYKKIQTFLTTQSLLFLINSPAISRCVGSIKNCFIPLRRQ